VKPVAHDPRTFGKPEAKGFGFAFRLLPRPEFVDDKGALVSVHDHNVAVGAYDRSYGLHSSFSRVKFLGVLLTSPARLVAKASGRNKNLYSVAFGVQDIPNPAAINCRGGVQLDKPAIARQG